ncbi:MAG: PfkB family carbohydrate kinase, partial [Bacteroidota bacterium]
GYLVQNHDLIRTAVALAKSNGLLVSLDLASYNVVEANLEFLEEIIAKHVDIIFANEEEAKAFTGFEPKQALHHLAQFCEVAVVKTGREGSMVQSQEIVTEIGIIPVDPIDTTGAGDLYASGFLFGHSRGWPLLKCGEAGALLAGNIIEELGAKMPVERWEMVRRRVTLLR